MISESAFVDEDVLRKSVTSLLRELNRKPLDFGLCLARCGTVSDLVIQLVSRGEKRIGSSTLATMRRCFASCLDFLVHSHNQPEGYLREIELSITNLCYKILVLANSKQQRLLCFKELREGLTFIVFAACSQAAAFRNQRVSVFGSPDTSRVNRDDVLTSADDYIWLAVLWMTMLGSTEIVGLIHEMLQRDANCLPFVWKLTAAIITTVHFFSTVLLKTTTTGRDSDSRQTSSSPLLSSSGCFPFVPLESSVSAKKARKPEEESRCKPRQRLAHRASPAQQEQMSIFSSLVGLVTALLKQHDDIAAVVVSTSTPIPLHHCVQILGVFVWVGINRSMCSSTSPTGDEQVPQLLDGIASLAEGLQLQALHMAPHVSEAFLRVCFFLALYEGMLESRQNDASSSNKRDNNNNNPYAPTTNSLVGAGHRVRRVVCKILSSVNVDQQSVIMERAAASTLVEFSLLAYQLEEEKQLNHELQKEQVEGAINCAFRTVLDVLLEAQNDVRGSIHQHSTISHGVSRAPLADGAKEVASPSDRRHALHFASRQKMIRLASLFVQSRDPSFSTCGAQSLWQLVLLYMEEEPLLDQQPQQQEQIDPRLSSSNALLRQHDTHDSEQSRSSSTRCWDSYGAWCGGGARNDDFDVVDAASCRCAHKGGGARTFLHLFGQLVRLCVEDGLMARAADYCESLANILISTEACSHIVVHLLDAAARFYALAGKGEDAALQTVRAYHLSLRPACSLALSASLVSVGK